jgi:D-tyrosyl-tRNA(Tyr) deacylase
MQALLQRVTEAAVAVGGQRIAGIGPGLLVFLACESGDDAARLEGLLNRVLAYRIFADAEGRMNRSVVDVGGAVLLVPQFTLAADTTRGLRPSFTSAMPPSEARHFFEMAGQRLLERHEAAALGRFGADMQVSLVNDGPVTFLLRSG